MKYSKKDIDELIMKAAKDFDLNRTETLIKLIQYKTDDGDLQKLTPYGKMIYYIRAAYLEGFTDGLEKIN